MPRGRGRGRGRGGGGGGDDGGGGGDRGGRGGGGRGGGGGKKLNYKQKSSISFVEQDDPPFIQKMKEKLGYQPAPTLDDKVASASNAFYQEDDHDEDDLSRTREEDRPQVVVLNPEVDLNQKELDEELEKQRQQQDREKIEAKQITFKKPAKREAIDAHSGMGAYSRQERGGDDKRRRRHEDQRENEKKKEQAPRLLSFQEEDGE